MKVFLYVFFLVVLAVITERVRVSADPKVKVVVGEEEEINVRENTKIYLVAHGDQRQTANRVGWPSQLELETILRDYLTNLGKYELVRAHPYDRELEHGFIYSQKMGIEVFKNIPKDAPLIVAISVWCYSHHVLAGLRDHKGPILLVANWSGQWPGLVGMLNLAGSLTKMDKEYSRLWTTDGTDEYFDSKMKQWLDTGLVKHDTSHVHSVDMRSLCKNSDASCAAGSKLAATLRSEKAIMCIFDEGCMGMYNAIIDDDMLNDIGVFKERLSQSYLVSMMEQMVDVQEAKEAYLWLLNEGFTFVLGEDDATELTTGQVLEQMKMYIAGARISEQFGCDLIGVQYQQGLVHSTVASDLPEGLWNNAERPPVKSLVSGEVINSGRPITHFNEVDEGAGVDALINTKLAEYFKIDPATTLHDIRFGESFDGQFVWVFEISGAAPPSHFNNGFKGASSERQPPMYFPLGGGSLKGVSKPGSVLWSRVYVKRKKLHCDVGVAAVIPLPEQEQQRRWDITTSQWPVMNAVLKGVDRDQMMGWHNANHIQVMYVPQHEMYKIVKTKVAMMVHLGIEVRLVGIDEADLM